ncbi:MAG: radical SAM/SPASM domain-containing protein [Bacteroidetes bacterium]|nr:radical SAM/SPASM domain-containing protein [Bacteroidota bacterium]
MWGLPFAISIEPTNVCNLKCPECPAGTGLLNRPAGFISMVHIDHIINKLPKEVWMVNLYFQGEPLLHPALPDIIQRFAGSKRYVSLSTNAQCLSADLAERLVRSGLDHLIISMDGYDQVSYEKYRKGGDFKKVTDGIQFVTDARKRAGRLDPFIEIQSLLLRHNEERKDDIKEIARQCGADRVVFKTAQFYRPGKDNDLIPLHDWNRRYSIDNIGNYVLKNSMRNRCFRMWSSCVVTWDGKLIPCCFDKEAGYVMGELNKESLLEIWKGLEYQKFRKKVFQQRREIPICGNCTEGMRGIKRS